MVIRLRIITSTIWLLTEKPNPLCVQSETSGKPALYVTSLPISGTKVKMALLVPAMKLFAKQRFFSPVIVRGQEDQGPRIYGYSKTIYEQLLNILFDPDYGDITDIMEGNDIRLTYGRTAGRLFPETKIRVRPMKTALLEDTNAIQGLTDGIPDFSTLFDRKSTAEVQELLNQYIIGQDTEDSPNVEKYSQGGDNSIEKSFNELLNA